MKRIWILCIPLISLLLFSCGVSTDNSTENELANTNSLEASTPQDESSVNTVGTTSTLQPSLANPVDLPTNNTKPAVTEPIAAEEVLASYDELLAFIGSQEALSRGNRRAFTAKIENSRRQFSKGKYCPASNMINAFLNQARAFRKTKYPKIANDFYFQGQLLLQDLLASLDRRDRCAEHDGIGSEPVIELQISDNTQLAGQVRFGVPLQVSVSAGGENWVEMQYPGLETGIGLSDGSNIGSPKIPVLHRLIAVPKGAKPVLTFDIGSQQVLQNINAYPLQPAPVDADMPEESMPPSDTFKTPQFEKDQAAYQQDSLIPSDPVRMTEVGQMRDLRIYQLSFMPMQYNAVNDTAVLNNDFSFQILFEGGDGAFVSKQALNPFELSNQRALIESNILNGRAALEYSFDPGIIKLFTGTELIIISHPDFIDAANDLASWKRDKGISTRVVQNSPVSEGGIGTTKEEIKSYIQGRYDDDLIRPSYVLLLGDAEFIEPYYRSSSGSLTTGTDLDYSLLAGTDLLADIGVARIPVDTAEQAQTVVDKIINYEKTPPFLATEFYNTASFPAYFQCCRTDVTAQGTTERGYIETVELIRNALVAQGKTVGRDYFSDTTYQGGYTGDTTPRRYFNGNLMPTAIGGNSGFVWDFSQQDVIDTINDGRFLVIHRDHGGQNGWVFPALASNAVTNLDNGALLPVLFSVDCATGFFDNETAGGDYGTTNGGTYLLELMLREADGGVVGALGDTRNSPTWANNALTRGFGDAVFPTVLGAYGTSTSVRRLADILNYGKLYMFSQVGVSQTAGSVSQNQADSNNIMWHAYGDPTQEIWVNQPFILPPEFIQLELLNGLEVQYGVNGAVITALQNGLPLGRAIVENGKAIVEYVREPEPNIPVTLSASGENSVGILLTPPEPISLPDLVVGLDGVKNVFAGQNLENLLKVSVSNQGQALAEGTVDANGNLTGEGYFVDVVLSTDTVVPEGPATVSDTFLEDALLVSGRISRTPGVLAGETKLLSTDPPVNSDIGGVIPLDTVPGNYQLCARIDAGDNVPESDESNNVFCLPIVIEQLG